MQGIYMQQNAKAWLKSRLLSKHLCLRLDQLSSTADTLHWLHQLEILVVHNHGLQISIETNLIHTRRGNIYLLDRTNGSSNNSQTGSPSLHSISLLEIVCSLHHRFPAFSLTRHPPNATEYKNPDGFDIVRILPPPP